jgi:hypothetical protein
MYAFTEEDGLRGRHKQIVEQEVDLTKDQVLKLLLLPECPLGP